MPQDQNIQTQIEKIKQELEDKDEEIMILKAISGGFRKVSENRNDVKEEAEIKNIEQKFTEIKNKNGSRTV